MFLTPAEPPAGIIQRAEGMGWKDSPHGIRYTGLRLDAPQALQTKAQRFFFPTNKMAHLKVLRSTTC